MYVHDILHKKKNDRSQSRFRDLEPAQTHGGVASMFDDSLQGGRKSLSHRSYFVLSRL